MNALKVIGYSAIVGLGLIVGYVATAKAAETAYIAQNATPAKGIGSSLLEITNVTGRLNENCSAQVVYSDRDKVSGEVKTIVLTAKHCVADLKPGQTSKVEFFDRDDNLSETGAKVYLADVAGQSATADVAILRLRDKDTYFTSIALEVAKPKLVFGEDVITVGYPRAQTLTVTTGVLGVKERQAIGGKQEAEFQRATSDIVGGSSGGGLYHKTTDGTYKLIGITTAGLNGAPFYGLYTPIGDIVDYLKVAVPGSVK